MSIERNVVIHNYSGRELHVDLYQPDGGSALTRSAVLLIHGGGWAVGHRNTMEGLARAFAARGFLAVAVEYRLLPEAPWPAALEDVSTAAKWTASNAERLGIDPARIVLAGSSAGGHLALLATARLRQNPRIAAVISLFAASDLTLATVPEKGRFNATALLGAGASEATLRAATPLQQLTADFPPVLLLHGGADWLIDPIASQRVYDKLVSLGCAAELHILAGATHEFTSEPRMVEPVVAEAAWFLDRLVLEPQRWAAEAKANNLFAQGPEAFKAAKAKAAAQGAGHSPP